MSNYFENVIGYDDIKLELSKVIDIINNPEKYEKFGTKIPKNLMLYGVPGTGKTLLSLDFINSCNRKSYILRKDKPNGSFTEEIKKVFNDAKDNAPSIILLDDMDKFSNGDGQQRNCEEYITVQSCIDDVKNSDVFIIATVNERFFLPDSLLREGRFDRKICIDIPKGEDAEKIINHYLKDKRIDKSIDNKKLTRLFSGRLCAFIESVINYAGLDAGYENRDVIDIKDIIFAYVSAYYGERIGINKNISKDTALKVSYHEAGHMLINAILFPDNLKYCGLSCDESLIHGITEYYKNINDHCKDDNYETKKMMVSLAGKAAIEIVYGQTDIGASQDIEQAKDTAYNVIRNENFYSIDYSFVGPRKEPMTDIEKHGISSELTRVYKNVKKVLLKNRSILDDLANELVSKQVLFYDEIEDIIGRHRVEMPELM